MRRAAEPVAFRGGVHRAGQRGAYRRLASLLRVGKGRLRPSGHGCQPAQAVRVGLLMPRVHRVMSLLKRWLLGTHQGAVSHKHLDYYLDEFTGRNVSTAANPKARGKLFYRLVQQAVAVESRDLQDDCSPGYRTQENPINPQDIGVTCSQPDTHLRKNPRDRRPAHRATRVAIQLLSDFTSADLDVPRSHQVSDFTGPGWRPSDTVQAIGQHRCVATVFCESMLHEESES